MKLHLPKGLRSAVLACMAVVGGFATTIATGVVTSGALTIAFATPQAQAEYNADTCVFSGGQTGIDLTALSVPDDKVLTFDLTTGNNYFAHKNQTYAGDICIGSGTNTNTGLIINNGNTDPRVTITFAGKVTGGGILQKNGNGNVDMVFSGDVHEYTGDINLAANNNYSIRLEFNTTNSSSSTQGVSGTGKVTFSTGNNTLKYDYSGGGKVYITNEIITSGSGVSKVNLAGADDVVFAKNVTINSLTSNATSVTFCGTSSVGAGSTTSDIKSTLKVAAGAALTLQNITLNKKVEVAATGVLTLDGVITVSDEISGSVEGNVTRYALFDIEEGGVINGLSVGSTSDELKSLFNVANLIEAGSIWSYADGVLSVETTSESLTWDAAGGTENVWKDGDAVNWGSGKTFDNGDFVTFSGAGEKITLEGDVAASTVAVTGTGWEFSGAGSLAVEDTFTVGDGTTETHLTISNTGSKTFTGGIQLNENATLVVKDDTNWNTTTTGAGTVEIATGKYYDTTNGAEPAFLKNILGSEPGEDSIGTFRLSNGTSIKLNSSGSNEWEWLRVADTLEIVDGANVQMASGSHDYAGSRCASTIRLAGAGSASAAAGSEAAAALAFTNAKQTGFNSALQLLDNATIYAASGVGASFTGAFTTNGKTLTKTGGGTLKLTGAVSGDLYLNIDGGTLWADSSTLKKVEGSGIYVKMGSGEITVNEASSVDWSAFTGGLGVNNGTLNLSETRQLTALVFDGTSGTTATINVKAGASIIAERYMSNRVTSILNIESGSALTVTGGENSAWGGNDFVYKSTFLLNHYQTPSTINIDGNFNMLNNAHFSAVDRAASEVVVNVNNGGVMNVKGITIVDRNGRDNCGATLNLKSGSQLNIGQSGISKYSIKGEDLSQTTREQLILNIEAGATLGILDGVEKWSTERALTWTGDVTVNTQGYKVAENGIGGTREGGSAGTIELLGTVSGGVLKEGVGTLVVGAGSTLTNLAVNAGSAGFDGAATVTTLTMAANTGLIFNTSGSAEVGTFDKANLDTISVLVNGVIDTAGTYTLMAGGGATGFSITDAERVMLADLANGLEFESLTDGVLTIKVGTAAPVGALTWQTSDADNVWRDTPIYKTWLFDGDAAKEQRWTNGSAATFAGTGEVVAIEGSVSAESVVVTGSGWEFSVAGSLTVEGTFTVGDGTTDTHLTISNTGSKTFTGGIQLNENATLVVKDDANWNTTTTGAGTVEIATGKYYDTTNGAEPAFLKNILGSEPLEDSIGTFRLSNGTSIKLNSSGSNEWEWLRVADTLEIVDGANVQMAAGSHDYAGSRCASTIRIAGAGAADATAGTEAAAALAFTNAKQTGFNSALQLLDNATIYAASGVGASFTGAFTTNGKTLTKTGGGTLKFTGNVSVNSGTVFDVQAGSLVLKGSVESGNTLSKIGAGTLELEAGEGTVFGTGWATIDVQEGTLYMNAAGKKYDGKVKLGDGTTLRQNYSLEMSGGVEFAGEVTLTCGTTGEQYLTLNSNVTGDENAVVTLNLPQGQNPHTLYFTKANDFAGTWNVEGHATLVPQHEDAFKNATVHMDTGDGMLKIDSAKVQRVRLGGLSGSNGAVTQSDIWSKMTLELLTSGECTYDGTISAGIDIVMSGSGTQRIASLAGLLLTLKNDITVNSGTLVIGSVGSDKYISTRYGVNITVKQNATLKAALQLGGGGSLTLDLSGNSANAASLGNNTLDFVKSDTLTKLNLTLADNAQAGDTLTLLKDISALATGVELLDTTVGDYFEIGTLNVVSSGVAMQAEGGTLRPDLTAERLERSLLFFENNALKLTLAAAELENDPLYWDPNDDTATGAWSGSNWSASKESMGVDPGAMADGWSGSVIFTNQEGETASVGTVTVDSAATVTGLTVESGDYTFEQGTGGSLTVEDTLSIGKNGSATLDMETTAKNVKLTDSTASLTINKALTISDGGKVTATVGGTITNGLANDQPLVLEGASLGGVATKEGDVVSGNGLKLVGKNFTLNDVTLTGQINNTNADSIQLGGTVILDTVAMGDLVEGKVITYYDQTGVTLVTDVDNGYQKESLRANLFTKSAGVMTADPMGIDWQMKDDLGMLSQALVTPEEQQDGSLVFHISSLNAGTAYVAADADTAAVYDATNPLFSERATGLVLNGGDFILQTGLDKSAESKLVDGILAEQDGTVTICDDVTLDSSDVTTEAGAAVTLLGGGTYDLGAASDLNSGVELGAADDWTGTVKTAAAAVTDLSALGNENSTVDLTGDVVTTALSTGTVGTVKAKSLTADTLSAGASTLSVAGAATLKKGASTVGDAIFTGGLTLGSGAAATLTAGELSLSKLTVGHADSSLTATALSNSTLDIRLTDGVTDNLSEGDTRTLVTLTADDSLATLSLNGEADCTVGEYAAKYHYTIRWEEAAAASVVLTTTRNENYVKEKIEATTPNGEAGADIIQEMYNTLDPQQNMPGSALAAIMDAVDAGAVTDETAAAIAGSSISALGMALSGDVERQLRAIRNRTTSMGVNECVVNEGMPYFNAWFNAEGNRGKLSADGTAPGYTLDSWGGTVGFDVDVNPNLSMGLAITAMYGDFTAEGPDALEGDMDTYYLSLFARYADCAWTHTFVATVGMMDGSVERTVPGMYGTDSSIDGTTFGLMYEVGYVIPLDEDGEACVQPIFNVMLRHASVGSMTEDGSDAGLEVGKQSMTTLTFGLGARLQAVVGESLYNRASIFEARVLAKADVGDRRSEADVGFMNGFGHKATVQSAELGAIGLEVGAGLTIPLGDDDGSIFFDASLELRSGYTNVNGTVGYRINF